MDKELYGMKYAFDHLDKNDDGKDTASSVSSFKSD